MKILVALTGASGIIYGKRFIRVLEMLNTDFEVMISDMGKKLLKTEESHEDTEADLKIDYEDDLFAPPASGSFKFDALVVIPSSMKTVSAIANGFTNTLVTRTADVALKEKRKLILVPRETPLNNIHLENMLKLSKSGAIILPASPGFYHDPKSKMDLVDHIIGKVLDSLGIDNEIFKRWEGEKQGKRVKTKKKLKEVEMKIPVEIERAKNKIKDIGGKFIKKVKQKDLYFNMPEKELLRLRKTNDKVILGYKKILREDNSVFKEIETEVLDFNKSQEILKNLGFKEEGLVTKDRWYYELDEVTLELNNVHNLGSYLDFEVISENEKRAKRKIFDLIDKLGYSKNDIEKELYLDLIKDKNKAK